MAAHGRRSVEHGPDLPPRPRVDNGGAKSSQSDMWEPGGGKWWCVCLVASRFLWVGIELRFVTSLLRRSQGDPGKGFLLPGVHVMTKYEDNAQQVTYLGPQQWSQGHAGTTHDDKSFPQQEKTNWF